MICAGIDAGSRATKVVLFDSEQSRIIGTTLADQGAEQQRLAAELLERTCQTAQVDRAAVKAIVATGYGRNAIRFADTTITEITCHAQGVPHLAPDVPISDRASGPRRRQSHCRHRLRPQRHPVCRHDHYGNHLPCPGRSSPGAGRSDLRPRKWTAPPSKPLSPPATAATPSGLPTRPLRKSLAMPRAFITWRRTFAP